MEIETKRNRTARDRYDAPEDILVGKRARRMNQVPRAVGAVKDANCDAPRGANGSKKVTATKDINVPEAIVVNEIFPRLPARSLARFKAVSKSWHASISDPTFIRSHLDRSRKIPKLAIIPFESDQVNLYSYDMGRRGNHASFVFGQRFLPEVKIFSRPASSNGLLLLNSGVQLVLCNPTTKESLTLPPGTPSYYPLPDYSLPDHSHDKAGFGYVRGAGVYKVVQFFCRPYHAREGSYSVGLEVLTLGVDSSWRAAEDPPCAIALGPKPVSVGGVVYFAVDHVLHICSVMEFVLSFDLGSEKFTVIPPPPLFKSSQTVSTYLLSELQGRLCLLASTDPPRMCAYDVWILEHRTWVRTYNIDFVHRPTYLALVGQRDGKLLIQRNNSHATKRLVLYDPRTKSFETVVRITTDFDFSKGHSTTIVERCKPRRCPCGYYFTDRQPFHAVDYIESLEPLPPPPMTSHD